MKAKKLLFILFLVLGVLFVFGSALDLEPLLMGSNLFLVPALLFYYRRNVEKLFYPIVAVLLLFFLRDIFLISGLRENMEIILTCFFTAMLLLFICLLTGFQRSRIHPIEVLSFIIMYSFLAFLFYSLAEVVPKALPLYQTSAYIYLLLLMLLVAVSFTTYIMKSHLASLWFLVASASLLVSEVSLFFKLFIIEDFSVNLFYPVFHVFSYYAFIEYAKKRRKKGSLLVF